MTSNTGRQGNEERQNKKHQYVWPVACPASLPFTMHNQFSQLATGQSAETQVKQTTGSSYSLCRSQWRWRWQHLTGWFALSLFLTEVPCSHTTPHFAHLNHPGYELYAALSHVLHRTVVQLKALDGHNPKGDPTDAWWNWQSNWRNPQQ